MASTVNPEVAGGGNSGGGGGSPLTIKNDSAQVTPGASSLEFQTALKATAVGNAVSLSIDQGNYLTTPPPDGIVGYSGYAPYRSAKDRAIPLGGYPRRQNLLSWTGAASTNFRLAQGTGGVSDDYTDPNVGEPYNAANAAYGNNPTNGKSVKFTYGASSIYVVGDKVTLPFPVNVVGKNVYLTFKLLSGDPANLAFIVRLISNTTVSGTASEPNYHQADFIQPNGSQIKVGVWQTFALPIEAFSVAGTGATLGAITHAYLQINSTLAGSLLVGDLFVCPRVLSRGVVIIGFDDCRQDTWTHGSRYIRKYGFPAVLYPGAVGGVIRQYVDQFQMNLPQMKHLQNRYGWQIASQAWSTENPDTVKPTQTLPQFAGEMAASDAFYVDQGWDGGADGSFFSNVNKGGVRDEVFNKSFRTMRTFSIFSAGNVPVLYPDCIPYADPMNLRAWGMDTSFHTLALTSQYVDKAIAQKGVARFVFHGVDVTTANFTQLMDYIAQKQSEGVLDVMTEDQLVFTARARAFD